MLPCFSELMRNFSRPGFVYAAVDILSTVAWRFRAVREAAKRRETHFGRPRKLNPEQAKLAQRLIDEGKSVREIAETFNVHTVTIYRLSATAA
jgi:DNA invertase Pin-like site-specific DNA recombinase